METVSDVESYKQFWNGREYEHASEVLALKKFLHRIPQINRLADIGSGYGRLAPYYLYRAKRSVLIDSSFSMLSAAKQRLIALDEKRASETQLVRTSIRNISKKVKHKSFDTIVMIRILHYLKKPSMGIEIAGKLLKEDGYLILEFPNKMHLKARAKHVVHREGQDTSHSKSYSPDEIVDLLDMHGFNIIEKRSISNIRSQFLKKYLPINILLLIEEVLQTSFSKFNLGPSIFILAQKRG